MVLDRLMERLTFFQQQILGGQRLTQAIRVEMKPDREILPSYPVSNIDWNLPKEVVAFHQEPSAYGRVVLPLFRLDGFYVMETITRRTFVLALLWGQEMTLVHM